MVRATGSGNTDVGSVRDHNEDSFLVDNDLQLYIVADGMGGHAGGEIASAAAIDNLRRFMLEADPTSPISQVVEAAVHHTCAHVHALSQTPSGKRGMGSTVTLLVIHGGRAILGHAGDSRLYRFRERSVEQIGTDHTLVQRMVEAGKLKPEEAEKHPKAHVLVNAVGVSAECDVDVAAFPALPGDRFLLCSDGLSKYVDNNDTLAYFLAMEDAGQASHELIKWVLEGDADDNVTVLVVDIREETMPSAKVELAAIQEFETVSFSSGEVLVEAGRDTDTWVIIVSGSAEIWRWGAMLRTLDSGDSTGASAFLVPRASRGELRGVTAGSYIAIRQDSVQTLPEDKQTALFKLLAAHLSDVCRFAGVVDL